MRAWIVIGALVVAACGDKKPAPPSNEFEAFEQRYVAELEALATAMRQKGKDVPDAEIPTGFRAVYIGTPGVFIDRKRVATLAELQQKRADLVAAIDANAKLVPTLGYSGPVVVFDLGSASASTAIQALRLFVNRTADFYVARVDPETPAMASHILCTGMKLRGTPGQARDAAQLSVFLDKGRTWVGISHVNEFEEIVDTARGRDLDKLKDVLRAHKASAYFADRRDIELAASAGSAADVLAALQALRDEGFTDIAVLTPEQLSARPQL